MKIRALMLLSLLLAACAEDPIPEPEPFDDTVYAGMLHDSMEYYYLDLLCSPEVTRSSSDGKIIVENQPIIVDFGAENSSLYISIISGAAGSWGMYFDSNFYLIGENPLVKGMQIAKNTVWESRYYNLNSDTSLYYPDTMYVGILNVFNEDSIFGWIEYSVLDYRTINIISYAIEK